MRPRPGRSCCSPQGGSGAWGHWGLDQELQARAVGTDDLPAWAGLSFLGPGVGGSLFRGFKETHSLKKKKCKKICMNGIKNILRGGGAHILESGLLGYLVNANGISEKETLIIQPGFQMQGDRGRGGSGWGWVTCGSHPVMLPLNWLGTQGLHVSISVSAASWV